MMVVEECLVREDTCGNGFPVGMRVLAVDDDKTCLKLLENMLLKCNYNVTTTTQSVKALEMLRENKNMFDLVISDVNMPDMDGFKLLKHVGLEMDLPVIMLSGNGDKERVMKGVIHGACDYLMKPIRIEELQNIWQHVVRKKIDCKDQNKGTTTNDEKICNVAEVCSQDITSKNVAKQNEMSGQKRKEQSEEEEDLEEEEEDNDRGNDEKSLTRKKPRFIWDSELHDKFVDAVNQLGIEKAFPKKILDLMNVEGLTRENVASHLQKYRLSLKRPAKQTRMDATLDPYLQMGSLGGYGNFPTLSGSQRVLSSTLPSYASSQLFCRPNAPSGLNLRGVSSSTLVPSLLSQNISSLKQPLFSANERSSLLHGIRASTSINQFHQNNYPSGNMKLSAIDDLSAFTTSTSFPDFKATVNNANSSLSCISSNLLTHNLGSFINPSSVGSVAIKTKSFNPAPHDVASPLEETMQSQKGSLGNVVKVSCYTPQQNVSYTFDNTLESLASPNGDTYSKVRNLGQTNSPSITQMPEVETFYSDARIMESNDDCFFQQMNSLEGFIQNSCTSLDDIISEIVKQDQNETKLFNGELKFDAYNVGSSCS